MQEVHNHDQIKSEAGKFVNLFNKGWKVFLNRFCSPLMEHFLTENQAIKQHLTAMKEQLKLRFQKYEPFPNCLSPIVGCGNKFIKMQNILFPSWKRKSHQAVIGFMESPWRLHALMDAILDHLKQNEKDENFNRQIGEFYFLLMGILYKEEQILSQ